MILVPEPFTETFVAEVLPNVTVVELGSNPVPVITTVAFPVYIPVFKETSVIVGGRVGPGYICICYTLLLFLFETHTFVPSDEIPN